jgi:hypothetical protein
MHCVTSAFNDTLAIASWAWPWAVSSWRTCTKTIKMRSQTILSEVGCNRHTVAPGGTLAWSLAALADKLVSLMSSSREAEWFRTVSKEEMSDCEWWLWRVAGGFVTCERLFRVLQKDLPGASPFCKRLALSFLLCHVVRDEDAALSARPPARVCARSCKLVRRWCFSMLRKTSG